MIRARGDERTHRCVDLLPNPQQPLLFKSDNIVSTQLVNTLV